jgi:fatty acid desaturase
MLQAAARSMTECETNRVSIAPELITQLHEVNGRHYGRLLSFLGIYAITAYSVYRLAIGLPNEPWRWIVCVPLYILAAAALHGVSLFTHEGVHGTLSRNPRWNRALSILCALPVWQNYSAYRVLHLKHHSHLGDEGDPDHYANYTSWTWLEFMMHWGRLIAGYPAYITAIPILGYRQGNASERRWIVFELAMLALLVVTVLILPIPWALLLHGWLIPMLVINTLVNIRGMSQHTFLEQHSDPILGTRSILTNPVTAFFMCNENYHLEHHLYPGVPWYNLKHLHQALYSELKARGAPFISSYFAFVREFVAGSIRLSPLGRSRDLADVASPPVHEGLLIVLGATTTVALAIRSTHWPIVLETWAATTLYLVSIAILFPKPSVQLQKCRLAVSYAFVAWFYFATLRITPALGTTLIDGSLLKGDERLFQVTPAVWCQQFVTPLLSDVLSLCYLSYHVYLPVAFAHALWMPLALGRRFSAYFFSAYAIGQAGYLLAPAVGPGRAFPELFATPIVGGWCTQLNAAIVAWGSSVYDAFPSLHVLATFVVLDHDWRFVRRRFWVMLLPVLGLVLATIYLRYHYALDLMAGFALFVILRTLFRHRLGDH